MADHNSPEKQGEQATIVIDGTCGHGPEEPVKFTGSRDIALQLVNTKLVTEFTLREERKTLRLIDFFLIPLMFVTFALQYMDKSCLTGAAIFGIIEDLDLFQIETLHGESAIDLKRYSYASLIFFWGFLAGLFPGVYLCQRFPIGKYVSVTMFLWGGVTICTAAVRSYQGLYVQRFFLGFTEASISPAFSLITVMWYKRSEVPLRYAVWYSASGIAVLVGNLLLYAIGHISGSLRPWKYQFIIIGSITSLWAIALWFLLPDSPVNAIFLSERQKIVAVERLRADQIGIENKTVKPEQVREVFTDPKTYFYITIVFTASLTNGAATGFGSIIVQSFGYTSFRSTLLLGAAGVTLFIWVLGSGLIATFIKNTRTLLGMLTCLPVIAGCIMIWKSNWENRAVPLWGFFILTVFANALVMVLTLMAANTAGYTKKAVTAGLVWATYCVSNGVAPLLVFGPEKKIHYPTTFKIVISMMSLVFLLFGAFRWYLLRLNRKRDAIRHVVETEAAQTGFMDLTDRENMNFRYEA